ASNKAAANAQLSGGDDSAGDAARLEDAAAGGVVASAAAAVPGAMEVDEVVNMIASGDEEEEEQEEEEQQGQQEEDGEEEAASSESEESREDGEAYVEEEESSSDDNDGSEDSFDDDDDFDLPAPAKKRKSPEPAKTRGGRKGAAASKRRKQQAVPEEASPPPASRGRRKRNAGNPTAQRVSPRARGRGGKNAPIQVKEKEADKPEVVQVMDVDEDCEASDAQDDEAAGKDALATQVVPSSQNTDASVLSEKVQQVSIEDREEEEEKEMRQAGVEADAPQVHSVEEEQDDAEEDEDDDDDEEEDDDTGDPITKEARKAIASLDRNSRQVFKVFERGNRPFGMTALVQMLKSLTRLNISKAIDKLVELELVRTNEKKIFWLHQNIFSDTSEAALENAKTRKAKLQDKLDKPTQKLARLKDAVAKLKQQPVTKDLGKLVREVQESVSKLQAEHAAQAEVDSKARKDAENDPAAANDSERIKVGIDVLKEERKFYRAFWSQWRSTLTEMVKDLLEVAPKSMKLPKLFEDLGIDTDEAAGVSIRSISKK
ncbi:Homologous-pairing protein 2, partial [Durusdinium trenchii]